MAKNILEKIEKSERKNITSDYEALDMLSYLTQSINYMQLIQRDIVSMSTVPLFTWMRAITPKCNFC